MGISETLSHFYDIILSEDNGQLLSLFDGEPVIDTPCKGRVHGKEAFIDLLDYQRQWLHERKARTEVLAITETAQRICVEIILYMQQGNKDQDLPIAIMAELSENKVLAIRIYHSTWPLTGKHRTRSPLMKPAKALGEPEFIMQYMQALGNGDANTILDLFEDDGYAREPSGSEYKHSGKKGLEQFYSAILNSGGISLKHCTAMFDKKRAVVEYIADAWGRSELPPQAGVAVYELGKSGKIHAARIYDDVTPPGEE